MAKTRKLTLETATPTEPANPVEEAAPTPIIPRDEPKSPRERIIDQIASEGPLYTGPQEEIPEPLPPVPAPRQAFYIPDESMYFDLYL